MIEAARARWALAERQPDGATLRDHLESAWRQRQHAPEAMPTGLRLPAIPAALAHVWDWFCDLSAARSGNGGGPNPIAFTEMEAWMRLTGRIVAPRDVLAIGALDQAYFTMLGEQDRRRAAARNTEGKRR